MIAKKFCILALDERIWILNSMTDEEIEALYSSMETPDELDAVEETVRERKIRRAKAAIQTERQKILNAGLPPTWKEEDSRENISVSQQRARDSFQRAKGAYDRARKAYLKTKGAQCKNP